MNPDNDQTNYRHGWKRSDSKNVIRIDHSNVHIENDKLGEDLECRMANIHRSRYRQFLERDSQIIQLRKSLAKMKQVKVGDSILNRNSFGKQSPSPTATITKPRLLSATSTSFSQDGSSKVKVTGSNHNLNIMSSVHHGRGGGMMGAHPVMRNISITLPHADKNVDLSDSSSDDDDDEDNIDETDGRYFRGIGHSRPMSQRPKTSHYERISSKYKPRTLNEIDTSGKRNISLKKLRQLLKLDQIPPAWYTTVVPASDVNFYRRSGRSILQELTKPSNDPDNVYSPWESSKTKRSGMPASKSTNSSLMEKRLQQSHDKVPLRPHTSLGMNHTSDNVQAQAVATSPTPVSGNARPASRSSRPMTALTCLSVNSKTVRQLREISEQDEGAMINETPRKGVDLMLDETREKRKIIDQKVNLFLKSLDELQKAKRWKEQGVNVQPDQHQLDSTPGVNNLGISSFTSAAGLFLRQSNDPGNSAAWLGIHASHRDGTKMDGAVGKVEMRPTTVS